MITLTRLNNNIIIQQSYFVIDVGVHPLLEERGDLVDISVMDISKDDLSECPLIVSLKQQRHKQVVRENTLYLIKMGWA